MTDNKYGLTTWGQQQLFDLEVPSGQVCQVRAPGVENLIAAGVLDSADTLTSLVDEKHIKRVGNAQRGKAPAKVQEIDGASLLKDPENLGKVFTLIDRIVCHMVVQPQVKLSTRMVKKDDGTEEPHIIPFAERSDAPGVVYSDQIGMLDKMFIFQYAVGGGEDLESFREQFGQNVGSLAAQ